MRTQIRRRNSNIRLAASFERPEWSYINQGDILYDTEIEQTRTDEEYVTKNEEEQEVERDDHRRLKIKMTQKVS